MVLSKSEMYSFFFEDPKHKFIEKRLNSVKLQYFYLQKDLNIITNANEVLQGCLLSGSATISYIKQTYELKQFDFFFLPPEKEIHLKISLNKSKICMVRYKVNQNIALDFEIQHYDQEKFISRGEFGTAENMTTYRTVWTAYKNGFFMSGFTNIPNESLRSGVITSVNLEKDQNGNIKIYSHIHPEYPEVYIMCINDEKYAITQYLVNEEGDSVCKDLTDGDGLFFPGILGHSNFGRPTHKNLKFAMYMWIIPTFGKINSVNPITLKI